MGMLIAILTVWSLHRDAAARGLVEAALKVSEEKFRLLLDGINDYAILMLDPDGVVVSWNTGAEQMYGYTEQEIIGQSYSCLFLVEDILQGRPEQILRLAASNGWHEERGLRIRRNGVQFMGDVTFTALRDPSGNLRGFAKIDRDLTNDIETEAKYRNLLEAAPDPMVVVNQAGEIVLLNTQAAKQFGYRRDELIGQQVKSIIPEGFAERLIADEARTAAEASPPRFGTGVELYGRRKDGADFPIEIMLSPQESSEGVLVTAAIRDITMRKDVETKLQQMEAKYRGLLESAPDGIVVVNQHGEIVLVNAQAERQFGFSRTELFGQKVKRLIPSGFAERLIDGGVRTAAAALAQQIGIGIELFGQRKDGTEFPVEIMLSPLESSEETLITATIRDITIRKNAEKHLSQVTKEIIHLAHSAEHDSLTGLPNRLLLSDRICQAIAVAQRRARQIAVLFLDLDGFKHVNDSLGHSTGDKLLQSVAQRLKECVRAPDTVSRQGGDEFILLLPEIEKTENAAITARRVLQALAEPHSIEGQELHITASIGVSVYPDNGMDAESLIKNADTAMYQAKENGRQNFKFFTPEMNVRAVDRQSIEEDLRRAVERHEFALHYQPKINLKTGAITGAEALLRWTHPTRGSISPLKFIPVAEDSGLILPIGAWVLKEACRQARAWLDAGLPNMTMAVNVSYSQFRADGFLDFLFAALDESGLDPAALEVEVTESVLMKHARLTASILKALRARGVQISLDDFGTGYSSLSYLQKFSLDALKIDQSFVRQITSATEQTTIVSAIISMGQSLGLRIIAEGVESAEDVEFLKARNCDEAQGYYFSSPVPAEEFAKLLAA